jgi:hypothetical protein
VTGAVKADTAKPNETTAKGERLVTSSGILCKKDIEPPGLMGGASSGLRGKRGVAVAPMSFKKAPSRNRAITNQSIIV